MRHTCDVAVIGAGVFGLTAALELAARGNQVAVLDPGPVPHPLAASTDISKVVRLEYGADEEYMALGEVARDGWLAWNRRAIESSGDSPDEVDPLYHETGLLVLAREAMAAGGFEHESYHLLRRRGHRPERLDVDALAHRFPAWRRGAFADGFYHARGGYADSSRTIAALAAWAREAGVTIHEGHAAVRLLGDEGRVTGVATREGLAVSCASTVVAAGAWTPLLVPEFAALTRVTGHPVFHLRPADLAPYRPPGFVVFTADIARTGWYGFPAHPREGVVKIARHGVGQELHPDDARVVTDADTRALRAFLRDNLPGLAGAPIVYTRRCLYCDTHDGHFVIAAPPGRQGLCVASGGSGHGFKFAPVLGSLIADRVTGAGDPRLARFAWRELSADAAGEEAARGRAG